MVRDGLDVGLLSSREQECRVEVDHDYPIILALAATDLAEHLVGHVSRYVVEVTSVRVRQDYRTSCELAEIGKKV
jgi:hypothetical protein